MTIQEAYGELGGNYEEMSYRINEKLLPRLISMLLKDSTTRISVRLWSIATMKVLTEAPIH